MKKYMNYRKNLKALFKLDGTNESFDEFSSAIGVETRSAHVWKKTAE